MEYIETIITVVITLAAVLGFAYKQKYELKAMSEKLDNHINDSKEERLRIKNNITTLFDRDRKTLEDITELKTNMTQVLENTQTILQKLNS